MKDKLIERAKLAQGRGKVGEAMRLWVLADEWRTIRGVEKVGSATGNAQS